MTEEKRNPRRGRKKKKRIKAGIRRTFRQTLLLLLTVILTFGLFSYIALLIVLKGPSPTFSNMVVSTMWETRRGKAIVNAMFSDDEIEAILSKNAVDNTSTVANLTRISRKTRSISWTSPAAPSRASS